MDLWLLYLLWALKSEGTTVLKVHDGQFINTLQLVLIASYRWLPLDVYVNLTSEILKGDKYGMDTR